MHLDRVIPIDRKRVGSILWDIDIALKDAHIPLVRILLERIVVSAHRIDPIHHPAAIHPLLFAVLAL